MDTLKWGAPISGMQALENFNWVDVLVILLLLRSTYIGARIGLTAELFKLIGTVISIALGLHYYNEIAEVLVGYIAIPIWILQFIILVVIILSIRGIFKYGIVLILRVLNIQFVSQLEKIGGTLIGLGRGILIWGLVLIILSIFPFRYLNYSICEKSFLAPYFIKLTKKTYTSIIGLIPLVEPKEIKVGPPVKRTKPKQTKPYSR